MIVSRAWDKGAEGNGEGWFQQNRGILRVGERLCTTNSLQALTSSSCDKKQTPTMFAILAGVGCVVRTKLGPLASSWVIGLKDCQSCKSLLSILRNPPQSPTHRRKITQYNTICVQLAKFNQADLLASLLVHQCRHEERNGVLKWCASNYY